MSEDREEEKHPLIPKGERQSGSSSKFIGKEKIHFSRWQSLSGICLYVSVSGLTYAFGLYSSLLKTNLGFSQGAIEIVASVGNTGLYLSVLAGLMLERFGLQFVVYLGSTLIFVGFLYIYLAVQNLVPADIGSVCVFFFLSQFGVCCHISSAVATAVRLFPSSARGSAVGLSKGYFALSSAVLSDFSGGFFANSTTSFILFVTFMVPLVGYTGASVANILPDHLVSFDTEKSKGLPTTRLPFFVHWLTLWCILFTVGYVQFAYELSGPIVDVLPSILACAVLSIQLLPSMYGSRFISDAVWENRNTGGTSTGAAVAAPWTAGKLSSDDGKTRKQQSFSKSAGEVVVTAADSNAEQQQQAKSVLAAGDDYNSDDPPYNNNDDKVVNIESGLVNKSSSPSSVSVPPLPSSSMPDPEKGGPSKEEEEEEAAGEEYINVDGGSIISNGKGKKTILGAIPETNTASGLKDCFYGESVPLSVSWRTWRFWALYATFLTVCGTGLMVIDNVNEIAEAVNKYPSSFFVALISLANGAGRVSAGLASDKVKVFSHLEMLSMAAAAMGVAQSAFAIGSESLLYPSLLAVGYLFGCTVSLMAVNVADIFGSKYVATNFGAVDSAPIFGSYIFVTSIIAIFYKTNYVSDEGDELCIGSNCFRTPFIINASCCFCVALLVAYMHMQTPLDDVNTGAGH